jgi:predicted small metal-binding protein
MPVFKCRNIGKKCRFEVEADTEEQVMEAALEHVGNVHDNGNVAPETIKQIRKSLRQQGKR